MGTALPGTKLQTSSEPAELGSPEHPTIEDSLIKIFNALSQEPYTGSTDRSTDDSTRQFLGRIDPFTSKPSDDEDTNTTPPLDPHPFRGETQWMGSTPPTNPAIIFYTLESSQSTTWVDGYLGKDVSFNHPRERWIVIQAFNGNKLGASVQCAVGITSHIGDNGAQETPRFIEVDLRHFVDREKAHLYNFQAIRGKVEIDTLNGTEDAEGTDHSIDYSPHYQEHLEAVETVLGLLTVACEVDSPEAISLLYEKAPHIYIHGKTPPEKLSI